MSRGRITLKLLLPTALCALLALAAVVVALLMRGRGARDEALNAEDEAALAELLAGEKDSQ